MSRNEHSSRSVGRTATTSEADPDDAEPEAGADLDRLRAENERLRREYARAKRTTHRRTAIGFLALGLLALGGAALFPDLQTVLVALGGTGLFGGVLSWYLTPERFVAASVGERVYAALADSQSALVTDLGLSETRVYVPVAGDTVRLFVPQYAEYELPERDALDPLFVIPRTERARGVALVPTGATLAEEFETIRSGPLATEPAELATQVSDALVDGFELAESATTDGTGTERFSVGITGSVYGQHDRVDHPIISFLAVTAAQALDAPVTTEVTTGDDRYDFVVTCRWESVESAPSDDTETSERARSRV
jgi:hypothetical protein